MFRDSIRCSKKLSEGELSYELFFHAWTEMQRLNWTEIADELKQELYRQIDEARGN